MVADVDVVEVLLLLALWLLAVAADMLDWELDATDGGPPPPPPPFGAGTEAPAEAAPTLADLVSDAGGDP